MKRVKSFCMLVVILILPFLPQGQTIKRSLTRSEAFFYANRATSWLDVNDKNVIKNTELVIMFLEADTIGRITSIHLLADNQKTGSLYSVLKKMKPEDFNTFQINKGASEKIVVVPIWSLRYWEDPNNYFDKMRMPLCPFMTEDHSAILGESYRYIQVNGLCHVVQRPAPKKVISKPERNKYLNLKVYKERPEYPLADSLYRNSGIGFIKDTILMKLQAEHDMILGYSNYNYSWGHPDKYNLLFLKNNKWTAIRYHRKGFSVNNEPFYTWDTIAANEKQIDSVLTSFRLNKGWTLSCFEEWDEPYCPQEKDWGNCNISDVSSSRLIMMTKSNLQTAAFYAPAYMEKCCPGWEDRARCMAIIRPIATIFKDMAMLK